jgi:hypothetical protein
MLAMLGLWENKDKSGSSKVGKRTGAKGSRRISSYNTKMSLTRP